MPVGQKIKEFKRAEHTPEWPKDCFLQTIKLFKPPLGLELNSQWSSKLSDGFVLQKCKKYAKIKTSLTSLSQPSWKAGRWIHSWAHSMLHLPNNAHKQFTEIRPHRRCWGVIVRMALVKGYRFTLGGGIFRPKPPVFDRSWRSPSKNTVKNSTEDTCSWTRPSKIGKRKVKKNRVFQLFDLNFLVCNIFFGGSAGGLARRRIFEFLDPFSDWFSSFCDSRNTGFYSVFLFSACLTASFKTSKNLVNYAVLCYGVNENIVNTSVFWRWLKKHCKLQCFWPPDPQKPWYLQWFLLLTAQKHCK